LGTIDMDVARLPILTKEILEAFAAKDYKSNPGKYKLTPAQIQKLLRIFEQNSQSN
jgi:hypothetical protein